MNFDLILVLVVLFGTLVMFMWGKIRYDLVALMALFIIAIADLVTAERVFAGFGHPAVITVASVLVVSKALLNAGIVDVIANIISKAGDKLILQITVLTVFSAIGSSFMNNVGALSLLLPVALTIAKDSENPPSLYLMPLAFGSILGEW